MPNYLEESQVNKLDSIRDYSPNKFSIVDLSKKDKSKESSNVQYSPEDQIFIDKYTNLQPKVDKALNKRYLNEEANKYTIPYLKDKEIRLRVGKYNTGKISTNILDSIYDSSKRTGVPFEEALGLAGVESTIGIGRGLHKNKAITHTNLFSNWQQIQPRVVRKSESDRFSNFIKKNPRIVKENFEEYEKVVTPYIEQFESFRPMKEHPIDNALKLFKKGKYNTGEKGHTQKVKDHGNLLMTDPAIQKWYQTKTK